MKHQDAAVSKTEQVLTEDMKYLGNMGNKEIELCCAETVQLNVCKHTARTHTSLGEMSGVKEQFSE